MPDLLSITSLLSSVKTATDIAKFFRESDLALDKAEAKLKISDLLNSLADVKFEVSELQSLLLSKDDEIRNLKELIAKKNAMKFDGIFYRVEGDSVPYCAVCFERDHKSHHLTYHRGGRQFSEFWHCKICNSQFNK